MKRREMSIINPEAQTLEELFDNIRRIFAGALGDRVTITGKDGLYTVRTAGALVQTENGLDINYAHPSFDLSVRNTITNEKIRDSDAIDALIADLYAMIRERQEVLGQSPIADPAGTGVTQRQNAATDALAWMTDNYTSFVVSHDAGVMRDVDSYDVSDEIPLYDAATWKAASATYIATENIESKAYWQSLVDRCAVLRWTRMDANTWGPPAPMTLYYWRGVGDEATWDVAKAEAEGDWQIKELSASTPRAYSVGALSGTYTCSLHRFVAKTSVELPTSRACNITFFTKADTSATLAGAGYNVTFDGNGDYNDCQDKYVMLGTTIERDAEDPTTVNSETNSDLLTTKPAWCPAPGAAPEYMGYEITDAKAIIDWQFTI